MLLPLLQQLLLLLLLLLLLQWNLSKGDTYETEVFVRFREVSALERFELKVPKFKVPLFYTGPTLTRTPPPPYLIMGM